MTLNINEKYKNFITWDEKTGYTVWDETQAYEVGTTWYPKVAEAMMDAYGLYYLEPQFEENVCQGYCGKCNDCFKGELL